ncbi:phosphate propanoyltransferase [Patescibacteria group bacterium]
MPKVNIEISARHVHLKEADFIKLFGEGNELSKIKDLSQKGEFATGEQVTIKVGEKKIAGVRVLGPFRDNTQVEISMTDARALKADVPLRLSGDIVGSAPVILAGPMGTVELDAGMIVAKRHLHISATEAEEFGVEDEQVVGLRVSGDRAGQLDQVIVRIKDTFTASVHLDTDEANALGVSPDDTGELIISK